MTLQLVPFPATDYPDWRDLQVERRARWQFGPLWSDAEVAQARARAAVDGLAPAAGPSGTDLHRVLDDDRDVGWVWLVRRSEELLVLDADIDAPADQVLALLESQARAGGAALLLVDRMAGAPTPTALAGTGAFTVTASNMALRLGAGADPRTDPSAGPTADLPVRLVPMTEASFAAYQARTVEDYAHELHAASGGDLTDARERAREQHEALMPQGLASEGQRLFDVVEAGTGGVVGVLWLGLRPPSAAFVYDVHLHPDHRGRGLGRATLRAAEQWCRDAGLDVLGLNVFGHNTVARSLYDSLGYQVVVEELRRPLPDGAAVLRAEPDRQAERL